MNLGVISLVSGILVVLSIVFGWLWRMEQDGESLAGMRRMVYGIPLLGPRKTIQTYRDALQSEFHAMGESQRSETWYRVILVSNSMPLILTILYHQIAYLFIIPVIFFGPLFYLKERRKAYRRKIEEQTRLAKILTGFLVRAGATVPDTFQVLENNMEYPFKDRIVQINIKKRYSTLPVALEELSKSVGVSQLSDFATIISEAERYGTPLSEAVLRSLSLESKLRDAKASQRYGDVQLQLGMYATLMIAFPGFGIVIYGLLAYAFHLFTGPII